MSPDQSIILQMRMKLEVERQALASFVSKFDSLAPSKISNLPMPTPGGAHAAFAERQQAKQARVTAIDSGSFASYLFSNRKTTTATTASDSLQNSNAILEQESPVRLSDSMKNQPSLLEQAMPEEDFATMSDMSFDELEVEHQLLAKSVSQMPVPSLNTANRWKSMKAAQNVPSGVGPGRLFGDKENIPEASAAARS